MKRHTAFLVFSLVFLLMLDLMWHSHDLLDDEHAADDALHVRALVAAHGEQRVKKSVPQKHVLRAPSESIMAHRAPLQDEGGAGVGWRRSAHKGFYNRTSGRWHVRPYGHTKTLRFGRVSVVPQKRRSSEEILAQSAGFFECLLKRPKEECDTEMLREGPGVPDKLELSAFSGVASPSPPPIDSENPYARDCLDMCHLEGFPELECQKQCAEAYKKILRRSEEAAEAAAQSGVESADTRGGCQGECNRQCTAQCPSHLADAQCRSVCQRQCAGKCGRRGQGPAPAVHAGL